MFRILTPKLRRLTADRSGDTIIEVMVVLAVLGLSIGLAYATANRSLLNARQAQEHSAAAGLVETQVENLRLLVGNSTTGNTDPTTNIFLPTTPFCVLNPNAAAPIDTTVSDCSMPPVGYTVLIYNCDKQPAAAPCATAIPNSGTFAVQATWTDVLGQGTDSVTITYRLHDPNPTVADIEGGDDGHDDDSISASLAISGGSGPVGLSWSGNAYKSGDNVLVTVSGIKAGDKCVIKNDKGTNLGTVMLTVTADATGKCTGKFRASKAGDNQTAYLTAYVTDSGNTYTSNTVSFQAWANTPTHYACSFPGPYHVYKGVSYSNWYVTLNSDSCISGTTCYSPAGYCTTYMPTLNSYQNFDVACWTGASYIYGSTWTGGDDSGTPCPPGTTRISLAPAAPPGMPGSVDSEAGPAGKPEGAWA